MTETTTTSDTLVMVQGLLHRALARLDEVGAHVAAAHLLATIDALDDRLETSQTVMADVAPERPLDVITKALRTRYGDQAETVARNQLAVASGDGLLTWACVVKRIEASGRLDTH